MTEAGLPHISSILYLAIVSLVAVFYSRIKPIVILPALMLGSLVGKALGLEIPVILTSLSPFALALLVFIAGVELDVDFVKREKERLFLFIFFEASIILSLYGVLRTVMSHAAALTLTAIMIASNEAFAYEFGKRVDRELANYGIAISILEDSLAVFLASVGYFTVGLEGLSREAFYNLLVWSVIVLLISIILARWIDKLIKGAEENTKLLMVLLYLIILISISEFLKLPEALVIFIGAIAMAIQGLDKPVFEVLEGLMTLALMGFVMILPYDVVVGTMDLWSTFWLYIRAAVIGFALAILVYVFRAMALFVASFLSGMEFVRGLRLTLVLANTGEFGLLVLATLLAEGVKLPPELSLGAMFAYAFNLTILNVLTSRVDGVVNTIMLKTPRQLMDKILRIHQEVSELIESLIADIEFKYYIYQLAFTISITYLLTLLFNLKISFEVNTVVLLFLVSSILASLYLIFQKVTISLRRMTGLGVTKTFSLILRLLILYVTLLPLISIVSEFYTQGMHLVFSNPLTFIVVVVLSIGFISLTDKIFSKLMHLSAPSEEEVV